jgi:hypothetical protein
MQRSWCFLFCALTYVARYVHLREHFLLNSFYSSTALTVTPLAASPPVHLRCIHTSKLIPPLKTVPLPCSYCAPTVPLPRSYCAPTVVRSYRQHGTIRYLHVDPIFCQKNKSEKRNKEKDGLSMCSVREKDFTIYLEGRNTTDDIFSNIL